MRRWMALTSILVVVGLAGAAFGHAPKALDLAFDVETHLLRVNVSHTVRDAGKHYVNKITVELNGKKIIEQQFRSQEDKERQEAVFKIIDAKVGDEITVTAVCNISGRKEATLEVVKPEPKKVNPQQRKQ